jgi:hypothetical protein
MLIEGWIGIDKSANVYKSSPLERKNDLNEAAGAADTA